MKHLHVTLAVAVAVLGTNVIASNAPGDSIHLTVQDADNRAALVEGVKQIASPGVPGPLVVWGPKATVVCVGGGDGKGIVLPVVAAGELGKGRVVAFGHTGYLDKDTLSQHDTGRLIENSLRWAGRSDKPRVGVIDNDGLVMALKERGFAAAGLAKGWDSLKDIDVVCTGQGRLSEVQFGALHEFVASGHGVLFAGLGWGWLQVTHGTEIREHPGSRLLRDAGIAWADGTLDKTGKGGFVVGDVPETCHAAAALEVLSKAEEGTNLAQSAATLTDAVRTIPADDAVLMERCRELLEGRATSIAPTVKAPLGNKQGLERALLALQVELDRELPAEQVKAHPAAAAFPGEVAAGAERSASLINLDMDTPGWRGTGRYAPAGAVITVQAPDGAHGCGVRIGCHTDKLWHLDKWQRVPDISRYWTLDRAEKKIASPFGGLIYIDVPRKMDGMLVVRIEGAVESPRFVLGETSNEQWVRARNAPGAWAELETKKIIISVPSGAVRGLDDPEALMRFWDRISDAHATLAGIPLDRERPERYVADVQISAGYMHSGYPIMTHLDAAEPMTQLEKLSKGSWGLLHELGHNHQSGDWTFEGTGEVTCNLFALHAIDTICTPGEGRGHGAVDKPPSVTAYMERGAKFEEWKKDPFLALQMYIQMEKAFGWETFKTVFAEYRALPKEARPKNDAQKRDQWMVRFSRACGKNLGPFFVAWGVPTSEEARRSIADLPGWMPEGTGTK